MLALLTNTILYQYAAGLKVMEKQEAIDRVSNMKLNHKLLRYGCPIQLFSVNCFFI